MLRPLILIFAAVIPCSAVELDQFVNCGGATQSTVTFLPQQMKTDLTCDQNGVEARADATPLPVVFEVVAVPIPYSRQAPPGNVEASTTVVP